MNFRVIFASAALAVIVLSPIASRSATITGSFATWAAAAGTYDNTSNTGIGLYNTVTTIPLSDSYILTVAGSSDILLQPGNGWIPFIDGYSGDIVDTTNNTETISFSSQVTALGFEVSPDLSLSGAPPETFTVTLSDGTTTTLSGTYPAGATQFIGFFGGGETSITITTANAPDFAFGNIYSVPEPISMSLLLTGLGGLALVRRRGRTIC
jgi:hypothetical protein